MMFAKQSQETLLPFSLEIHYNISCFTTLIKIKIFMSLLYYFCKDIEKINTVAMLLEQWHFQNSYILAFLHFPVVVCTNTDSFSLFASQTICSCENIFHFNTNMCNIMWSSVAPWEIRKKKTIFKYVFLTPRSAQKAFSQPSH